MNTQTMIQMEATGLRDSMHQQERCGSAYWRRQAFKVFANYIFAEHIRPFQPWFSDSALCDRLNRLGVPVYRGPGPWTRARLTGIRRALPGHVTDFVDKRRSATVS